MSLLSQVGVPWLCPCPCCPMAVSLLGHWDARKGCKKSSQEGSESRWRGGCAGRRSCHPRVPPAAQWFWLREALTLFGCLCNAQSLQNIGRRRRLRPRKQAQIQEIVCSSLRVFYFPPHLSDRNIPLGKAFPGNARCGERLSIPSWKMPGFIDSFPLLPHHKSVPRWALPWLRPGCGSGSVCAVPRTPGPGRSCAGPCRTDLCRTGEEPSENPWGKSCVCPR